MLLTLFSIALIILAIFCYRIKGKFYYDLEDFFEITGVLFGLAGAIGTFCCIIGILIGHAGVDCSIEQNRIARESLCERLEVINSDYEDVSKSDVIKDVAEWNLDVYSYKYWTKNPWTSWFHSPKLADSLEYIETDE